jgi:hypothetical protein
MNSLDQVKKVLILGDSFVDINYCNGDKELHWINFLKYYYDWEVTNLSHSGSGINRVAYELLNLKEDFDLCIIAYSQPERIFHPDIWDINFGTAVTHEHLRRSVLQDENVWNAARQYYTHLYRTTLNNLKGIGLHQWIYEYIKEKYPDKFFIHFDSFSLMKPNETLVNANKKENQRIYHKFSHGITMYPSLMYMSVNDRHRPADLSTDRRLGHISQYQHMEIFMHIKKIMDENLYANDKVYIYCDDFNEYEVKIGCDEC